MLKSLDIAGVIVIWMSVNVPAGASSRPAFFLKRHDTSAQKREHLIIDFEITPSTSDGLINENEIHYLSAPLGYFWRVSGRPGRDQQYYLETGILFEQA